MHLAKVQAVLVRGIVMIVLALSLAGCGINNLPTFDEQVKAAWSQQFGSSDSGASLGDILGAALRNRQQEEDEA